MRVKDDIIPLKIGQNEADIANIKEDINELRVDVTALEAAKRLQDLALAKCTAIWGFIIMIATTIGGFIAYNYVKVKLAIIAVFKIFGEN